MDAKALVLAALAHLSPGLDRAADRTVVDGIAASAVDRFESPRQVVLITVYAGLESGAREHPRAWSWDARASVSCGYLQEPCALVERMTTRQQANWWWNVEEGHGLEGLDSDPRRAARRERLADRILREIAECPWHAASLAPWATSEGGLAQK